MDKENIDESLARQSSSHIMEDRKNISTRLNKQREAEEKPKTYAGAEVNIAKERNRKLLLENSNLVKTNKDLQDNIKRLETKLQEKEQKIKELSTFLKEDEKEQLMNDGTSSSKDAELLRLIQEFETAKDEITQENIQLRNSLLECQKELHIAEDAYRKQKLENLNDHHSLITTQATESIKKEIHRYQPDKNFKAENDRLEKQLIALQHENSEIKIMYEDLSTEYRKLERSSKPSTPIKIETKFFGSSRNLTPNNGLMYSTQKDQSMNFSKNMNLNNHNYKSGELYNHGQTLSQLTLTDSKKIIGEVAFCLNHQCLI